MSRRVVLDTNCIISALVFSRGKMAWLRQGWQAQLFIPLASKETVIELMRVLSYPKFQLSVEEQQQLLSEYLPHTLPIARVAPKPNMPMVRDVDDQKFLNLAISGKADFLVTGDQDLLVLKGMSNVSILTLPEFKEHIQPNT